MHVVRTKGRFTSATDRVPCWFDKGLTGFPPHFRCRATHGSSAESDGDGERGRAAGHRRRVLRGAELHEGPLDIERASVHTGRTLSRRSSSACNRGKFARLAASNLVPVCSRTRISPRTRTWTRNSGYTSTIDPVLRRFSGLRSAS